MAETYPCPNKEPDIVEKCLGKQWLAAEIYPYIITAANRVRAFQELMELPESSWLPVFITPPADYPAVDCIFTYQGKPPANESSPQPGEFYGLGAYMERMFNTGYVVKQVKYTSGELWTLPPTTKEDVATLQACGAFWGSWDEVYACMKTDAGRPFNLDARNHIFKTCPCTEDCMNYIMWNEFYQSVHCASDFKCFPDCMCVYCDAGGCQPCNRCITVQVSFDGKWAMLDIAGASGQSGCLLDFVIYNAVFYDDTHQSVSGLTLSGTVRLVKSYVMWTFTITDGRIDPNNPIVSTHQWEMDYPGLEGPSELCAELDEVGMLVNGRTVTVYTYDTTVDPPVTTANGSIMVSIQSGYTICARPWNGIQYTYNLDMSTIPVCAACPTSVQPECDGLMKIGGSGLELMSSAVSHLNRQFSASVEFDSTLCVYRMKISCLGVGSVWEGLSFGCGGPAGDYTTDPEFANPCFTATVTLLADW